MNFLKNTNRYPSYLQTILTSVLLSAIILITVIQQPLIQIGTPRVISNNTILTNFNFHVHCPLTNRTDRGFI